MENQKQHTAKRSIVPLELHLKALSCYVGLPAELLLPTNSSKCLDGGWGKKRKKESSLDRAVSDSSSSQSLHQIVRSHLRPEALQLNESGLATVRQYTPDGNQRQIA